MYALKKKKRKGNKSGSRPTIYPEIGHKQTKQKRYTVKRKKFNILLYPSVVIVTMVYQKAAGMELKFVPFSFFSA